MQREQADIIRQLQKEVLSLQGLKGTVEHNRIVTGLEGIEKSFPNQKFPTGAIHEFVSDSSAHAVATNSFIAGMLGKLADKNGVCLWVSTNRIIYPPALKLFGVSPERIVFIDLVRQKEALWVIEEGLKCKALVAVVAEIKDLGFTESRRLQLAVEHSNVTGFVHRFNPKNKNAVASIARWKIQVLPSEQIEEMPGLGFPKWHVQLLRVRNGIPGAWQVEWSRSNFKVTAEKEIALSRLPKTKSA